MTDNTVKLPEPVAWLGQVSGAVSIVLKRALEKLQLDDGEFFSPLFTADQLTAAVMADRAERWRTIESAPVDELILVGPTKSMGICAAMDHSRDGWVTETCNEWFPIYTPTHWQPLPQPPEGGE